MEGERQRGEQHRLRNGPLGRVLRSLASRRSPFPLDEARGKTDSGGFRVPEAPRKTTSGMIYGLRRAFLIL